MVEPSKERRVTLSAPVGGPKWVEWYMCIAVRALKDNGMGSPRALHAPQQASTLCGQN